MTKTKVVIIVALAIALLATSLLFVNLRAATSSTSTGSSIGTARYNKNASAAINEANGSYDRQLSLWLYVEGEDDVTASLRRQLVTMLKQKPRLSQVTLLQEPPSAPNHPVLVAAINDQQVTWTPIYSRAQLSVRIAYASDKGDISWRDQGPFVLDSPEPTVRMRGDITVNDETRGLTSRPAYNDHLGRAAAEQISGQLEQALKNETVGH